MQDFSICLKIKNRSPVGNAPSNIAVSKAQASLCRNPDSDQFLTSLKS